jgi:hypothetical protein
MRLRALAGLGLLACIGFVGTAVGCYDDPGAAPNTAFSVRRYPTAPPGQQTSEPPPQNMPGGGRGYSDFTKEQKGKP